MTFNIKLRQYHNNSEIPFNMDSFTEESKDVDTLFKKWKNIKNVNESIKMNERTIYFNCFEEDYDGQKIYAEYDLIGT